MEKQIKLFLEFLQNEKKLSDNTLQSYKRDIIQYQNYIEENQINYKYEREAENVKPGEIIVTIGGFSSGFENYDLNLIVISLQNNFEEPVKRKKKLSSTFKDSEKIVFADLKPGDIVVHQTHGIGQFIGVNTITADGVTKDYIKIKYRRFLNLFIIL